MSNEYILTEIVEKIRDWQRGWDEYRGVGPRPVAVYELVNQLEKEYKVERIKNGQ